MRNSYHTFPVFILFLCFIPLQAIASSTMDRGSKGYWLSRYGEIRPESYPLSRRAHDIFRKVLKASDRRKGVEPEFIIINYGGRPWAQSLVDGTVVLTKDALDFCYRDVDLDTGDSRLAFVIGHELAHQFNGDFWHYLFFQAAEAEGMEKSKAFDEIKDIVKDSENFMVKELQADQYGIIYASMAGYDVDAVVSEDKNFFTEWAKTIDPSGALKGTTSHPSPEQRALAIVTKLKDVTRHLSIFRAGVISYYIGAYKESIAMMEEFARFYPSKEVYNNLGTAYLSIAYENYKLWKGDEAMPFKISFSIDPHTAVESIEIGEAEPIKREIYFTRYTSAIEKAGEYLRRASESGYDYALSRSNLGCVYILEGRFHEAIAILDEAAALKPDDKAILNNRGIAYYYLAERLKAPHLKERAKADFKKASSIDREFSMASYNLSIMGNGSGREAITSIDTAANTIKGEGPKKIEFNLDVKVGEPLPADIKKTVKKGYLYNVAVDGKLNLTILDLPERYLTIVERNGLVWIVIARDSVTLKKANEIEKKGLTPDKKFTYGDTDVWLFPSRGWGVEFRSGRALKGFRYSAGF